ncbi:MAG: hypothetical protein GF313_11070 [Caldithrix sp.]|nr:hypothetical protein [Caldithrix sp.]
MLQRTTITFLFLITLAFLACEKQTDPLTPQNKQLEPVDLSSMDVEGVTQEATNIIGYTIKTTAQSIDRNESIIDEENHDALAKPMDWIYSWEDGFHVWKNTVIDGAFTGDFLQKVQYRTSRAGRVVANPTQANFMYALASAAGTYGFTIEDPEYGVEFDHRFESWYTSFKSRQYVLSAEGRYHKSNQVIFNGKDALLEIIVDIDIDQMIMDRAQPNTLVLNGDIVLEMNPWKATLACNGSQSASLTVTRNGIIVQNKEVDLQELFQQLNLNI